MMNILDISWKDFLAALGAYFVSAVLVGATYLGVGFIAAKTGGEILFARYEFLIACASFLAFFAGGMALGAIRRHVAVRNAAVMAVGLIVFGIWRAKSSEIVFSDVLIAFLQVAGGMMGGAAVMQWAWPRRKV